MEQFQFGDLISRFSSKLTANWRTKPTYADNGTEIAGEQRDLDFMGALVPFGNRQLQYSLNGSYTIDDRQLFTTVDLPMHAVVSTTEGNFKIDRVLPYQNYTDARIYYCKAVER